MLKKTIKTLKFENNMEKLIKPSNDQNDQEKGRIIGGCYINGKTICELREFEDDPDDEPDDEPDDDIDIDDEE